ncbi:hypothetical protein E4U54_000122, partial [Claviceps lovelessii]
HESKKILADEPILIRCAQDEHLSISWPHRIADNEALTFLIHYDEPFSVLIKSSVTLALDGSLSALPCQPTATA